MHPDALRAHPLSEKIYGVVHVERDLSLSIQKYGILEPILVTPEDIVISGHRRWKCASLMCMTDVPVRVITIDDPLLIEAMVIECNRQRAKTKEQVGREYKELKRIEVALAKGRQKKSTKGKENFPYPSPEDDGQARDIAAAKLDISGKTGEKMKEVVEAIDAAEATGDTTKAAQLRETFEHKSVSAAHREATGKAKPEPKTPKAKATEPSTPESNYALTDDEVDQLEAGKSLWGQWSRYVRAAFLDWAQAQR